MIKGQDGREVRIGTVLMYRALGGERRTVTVIAIQEEIKNERAGFDGIMEDGTEVWGYADQITVVLS